MSFLHPLTEEQELCVEAAKLGHNIKIKAFAGTGKTSTLVAIANKLKGRGLYLAYNKAIKDDADGKFPSSVDCKTAHSLAYAIYGRTMRSRLNPVTIPDIVDHIEIKPVKSYDINGIAYLAIKILRVFCNSNATDINKYILNASVYASIDADDPQHAKDIINSALDCAAKYWEQCTKPHSYLPIEHDFYLKLYQLSNPDLYTRYDYILFDECQDANPVILDIVTKQRCQKIYVGDEHQQIYEWRGAINAFEHLDGAEHYLSQSFRFGEAVGKLASVITKVKGESKALKGKSDIDTEICSKIIEPCAVLCRTNSRIIDIIINSQKKKLHVVGGTKEILNLAKSGFALYKGWRGDVSHNKLKQYKSWAEMVALNAQYKDADITFLIGLISNYQNEFKDVIRIVEYSNYVSEAQADVVLSTIHKSKGKEWDNVAIEDDFTVFDDKVEVDSILFQEREELNILYVAITRAKHRLRMKAPVVSFCHKLQAYLDRKACEVIPFPEKAVNS